MQSPEMQKKMSESEGEPMNEKFRKWLDGDIDIMEDITRTTNKRDLNRDELKKQKKEIDEIILRRSESQEIILAEQKGFYFFYNVIAVISCVLLITVLLICVANLPRFGQENERAAIVAQRYIEKGLEETGAVNIVSGMILDYRAFDTLGESHVLFTALICVMILLRKDWKNMSSKFEDYSKIRSDNYFATEKDVILQKIGFILVPSIFVFGIYVLLNGQNSPGGGFSGGAILGAAMIIFTSAFGFDKADRFFTLKLSSYVTFVALSFYSFAKGYVFITGANGLDNHIPKGIPGAILSGGLILPLDVAVGLVVACTMFGFYSLFRRGMIGGN